MNTVRLAANIQQDSIVDGEGLRTVIWLQGCPHHCPGCHNPETHDFNGGKEITLNDLLDQIENLVSQDGVTISGGEPFAQPEALIAILKKAQEKKLNRWVYTGYTFEKLIALAKDNSLYLEILKLIDILVDGQFLLNQKSLTVKFRGSTNQRIIDVKKSLKTGQIFLIPKYKYKPKKM